MTIPPRQEFEQVDVFGEDTEHELSLSRKDDSDLSVLSDYENDEADE